MDKVNSWAAELEQLRGIISKTGLQETVKWGGPVFTIQNKNVVGIAGFKHFFTIWFFKGAQLKDPAGVLINAQEGTTKMMRQWRFRSKEEIDELLIIEYIREATALETDTKK